MRAGGVAADREPRGGPKRLGSPFEQPYSGLLAVVGPGGIWILGREPKIDAYRAEAGRGGELGERGVLEVGGADRPATAVQVQEDANRRLLRIDHPQPDRPRPAGDLEISGLRQEDRRGRERAFAGTAPASRLRRPQLLDRRLASEGPLERAIELAGGRERVCILA